MGTVSQEQECQRCGYEHGYHEFQTRTGVRTDVIERVDRESQGFKVVERALIPWHISQRR